MVRSSALAVLILVGWASQAPAQIVIRAPFVRVQVGGGVYVRAPFVRIFVPGSDPVYSVPAPMVIPAPPAPAPAPTREQVPAPVPGPAQEDLPAPRKAAATQPMTLDDFAKSFQPREGSYEIVLQNPLTGAPATVQFTLPAGSPRRVTVYRRELEFDYGSGQWVRIVFDRRGARVTSSSL